jgi:putative sterol carrier protein
MTEPTLEEVSKAMTAVVDDKLKRKFNATVQFNVDGESYTLYAKKDGEKSKPDLQVGTSLATLQELLQKKMSPQQAFLKGKLKIKGKMSLAMKLSLVLDATRKHLAQQNSRL